MDVKNRNILFMEINASIRQQPLDNLESIVLIHNNSDDNHQRGKEGFTAYYHRIYLTRDRIVLLILARDTSFARKEHTGRDSQNIIMSLCPHLYPFSDHTVGVSDRKTIMSIFYRASNAIVHP